MSTAVRARHLGACAALLAGLAGALLGLTGCGTLACFEWDGSQGECPSREEASQILGASQSSCGGKIVSIDGDASYDGELCCYGATYRRPGETCFF